MIDISALESYAGQLSEAAQRSNLASELQHRFVHGGVDEVIQTESGPLPSLAKWRADLALLETTLANAFDPLKGTGMLGHMGRTLADHLGDYVNGKDHGMRAVPGYDNRLPLQKALAVARAKGVNVWVPGDKQFYEFGLPVWQPSGVLIYGDGGRSQNTMFKAMDGHFADVIISGEHDEGANHREVGFELIHRNGFPYTAVNIGRNIGMRGIYIHGNGDNAGFAPELTEDTDYRGCNVRYKYIDGVFVDDLWSEYAPNDCLYIVRCRRQWVQNCVVGRNRLKNFTGLRAHSTRNLLTCAGTMAWRPEFGALSDYMIIQNIQAEDSEDLGVCVQFVTEPGSTLPGGPVIIHNITTKRSATYGTAIEIAGDGNNQPRRELISISGITSIGDGWIDNLASVSVSHKSANVNISDINIKDAGGHGLLVTGPNNANISLVNIDGYGLNVRPAVAENLMSGIKAYAVGAETPQVINLSDIDIRIGSGRGDTEGLTVSGYALCKPVNVNVEGTTWEAVNDSAAIRIACTRVYGTNLTVQNSATNGIRLSGFVDFGLLNSHTLNCGRAASASAQKIGINVGPGTNRRGRIVACTTHDRQSVPTQKVGILLGVSATDSILVTGCGSEGNIDAPIINLGMPNARIHGNEFEYFGMTKSLNVGGNGGYLSGIKLGSATVWVEQATNKLRIKNGTPTSDADGTVVGTQS